jgi:amino acid transporter
VDQVPVTPISETHESDDADLRAMGVEPIFARVLGLASVSFLAIAFQGPISSLVTVGIAMMPILGPTLIWTVPVVLVFQIVLAVLWMEINSQYPLEGGIYQWARKLGGEAVGFFAGLFYLSALLILMSALGFGMQAILIGLFPKIPANTTSQVVITIGLTVLVAFVCSMPVRIVARVNSIGVAFEMLGLIGFSLAFLFHTKQSLSSLVHTSGAVSSTGTLAYLAAFTAGMGLMVGVLTGSETAGIFAEDSVKGRVTPGRATLIATVAVAVAVGLLFLSTSLATPDLHAAIANPGSWVTYALDSAVGSGWLTKVFLIIAVIAIFSTTIATLMSSSRLMFGMARDRQLPGWRTLSKTPERTGQPIYAIVTCAVLGVAPLIAASKIPILVSAFTAMFVLTYLLTLGSLAIRRFRGWPAEQHFSLGKWAWPLTLIGLAYVIFLAVVFEYPRASLNPHLGGVPVLWEFALVVIVIGAIFWATTGRRSASQPVVPPAG